eukprot:123825_1
MTSCNFLRCSVRKQYRILQYHGQSRTFIGFSKSEPFEKSGNGIEIGENDFILDEHFSPHYHPRKDVIIRNYSSALTATNMKHLILPFNHLTSRRTFYTNFCGIIEHIPKRYRRGPYKIGDRVWGIKPHYKQEYNASTTNTTSISSLLGLTPGPHSHNNAWSDYLSTDIRCISHLPPSIPLEYGGLFGTDLLMIFDGFGRINWYRTKQKIEGKKVLIIGTGRQSLLNILIPLLQACNVKDIVIVSSHKRHNKVLTKFNVKSIIDRVHFIPSKHNIKYDIIIDSLSINAQEIEKNVTLINDDAFDKTEYWVIRNPYHHIVTASETTADLTKGLFAWNKDIVRAGKKMEKNDVVVKPIRMVFRKSAFKAFAYWMQMFSRELEGKGHIYKYPIIVDRMYKLTNIEHAFEYCMDYDMEEDEKNHCLGEHIGLMIHKEDNPIMQQNDELKKIKVWKPVQLLDMERYEEKIKSTPFAKTLTDDSEFVDDN